MGKVFLWIQYKNVLELLLVLQFMPTLYHDHENFGKSTTIFIQNLKKTPVILRVNKHFWGRFCVSVLFNNCFPFSLKTLVKYNTDLLVVNKVAKIPWFCKHLKDVFLKNSTAEIYWSLKVQPCKWKKPWKMTTNVFQKYLERFAFQLYIILQ